MLSRFFIERPIFAWVLAIIVMLAGALSIINLPVARRTGHRGAWYHGAN